MSWPQKNGRLLALIISIFLAGVLLALPSKAGAAASLYVEPSSGTFVLGSTFTVSLYLNTGGQSVNAIEANLRFPPDKLQVVSPTAGKSLIQVWMSQPAYSNIDGMLKFQGTVPTPGINTDAGLISTVTFRVKSLGVASLRFRDTSQVLLNDGLGTNVLGQMTDGIYHLILPPPAGPVVTSRTHLDQGKWYSLDTVLFEWASIEKVEGFSYILNDDPAGTPDNISEGLKTGVAYDNLADGNYYFHIKTLREGMWGGVTTYVVRIDNTPPATFNINILPKNRTSNRRPLIDFGTTDVTSGVDHYELKIIPLDAPLAYAEQRETFFIETDAPYSRRFDDGRFEIIVRAYDKAGNYYQAESRLTIIRPLFEFIVSDGLRIGGGYTVAWPYMAVAVGIILTFLIYLARVAWRWHRIVEEQLRHGAHEHPAVADKLKLLKEKHKEYGGSPPAGGEARSSGRRGGAGGKNLLVIVLIVGISLLGLFSAQPTFAQQDLTSNVALEPPVVTLFPKSISNDEIVYVGGRAGAPQAKVLIYLQNLATGSTISQITVTDKDGEWFYSFPKFLRAGDYVVWTQLNVGEELSPPSSRMDLSVAPTAIQIGGSRLSFEDLYFILLLIFAIAFFGLLAFTLYHAYHSRTKNRRLINAIREVEESIRRGFSVLRRDIDAELNIIRKAKLSKELSAEEKLREEKLLKDFDEISRHIGQEVWQIGEAEG